MDHRRDFRKKQKEYLEVLKMQPVRDWGWDFSCLAERKMRRGIIIVFRYVKAAMKRRAMCVPHIFCGQNQRKQA